MNVNLINLFEAVLKFDLDITWLSVIAGMIFVGVRELRSALRERRPAAGVEHVGATETVPLIAELPTIGEVDHEFEAMIRAARAEIDDIHETTMAAFDHAMDDYLAMFHARTMVAHMTADRWHEDGGDVCAVCHPPAVDGPVIRGWREATHTGEYRTVHPTHRQERALVEALLTS